AVLILAGLESDEVDRFADGVARLVGEVDQLVVLDVDRARLAPAVERFLRKKIAESRHGSFLRCGRRGGSPTGTASAPRSAPRPAATSRRPSRRPAARCTT